MVVFAVDISRRMMELRSTNLQCGRRIQLRQRCNPISSEPVHFAWRLTARTNTLSAPTVHHHLLQLLNMFSAKRFDQDM